MLFDKSASRTFLFFFILFAFAPCWGADEGKPAPEFQAKLFDGENFTLSSNAGKVVLIHFWATWCDACRAEMSLFETYYKQHRDEGLVLVGINMDETKNEDKARALMKEFSFKSALAKDARYKSYGRIWRLPLTFVIDRKGLLKEDGWVRSHVLSSDDFEKVVTPLLHSKP